MTKEYMEQLRTDSKIVIDKFIEYIEELKTAEDKSTYRPYVKFAEEMEVLLNSGITGYSMNVIQSNIVINIYIGNALINTVAIALE